MSEEKIPELKFVDSIHEQREFKRRIVPPLGCWIEAGRFTPVIESFDIKERWKCIERIEGDGTIEVTIKKLDHKRHARVAKKIIDEIIVKHGQSLSQSMTMMLLKGVYDHRMEIERFRARIKHRKDPAAFSRWEKYSALEQDIKEGEEELFKAKKQMIKMKEEFNKIKLEVEKIDPRQSIRGTHESQIRGDGLRGEGSKESNEELPEGHKGSGEGEVRQGERAETQGT